MYGLVIWLEMSPNSNKSPEHREEISEEIVIQNKVTEPNQRGNSTENAFLTFFPPSHLPCAFADMMTYHRPGWDSPISGLGACTLTKVYPPLIVVPTQELNADYPLIRGKSILLILLSRMAMVLTVSLPKVLFPSCDTHIFLVVVLASGYTPFLWAPYTAWLWCTWKWLSECWRSWTTWLPWSNSTTAGFHSIQMGLQDFNPWPYVCKVSIKSH